VTNNEPLVIVPLPPRWTPVEVESYSNESVSDEVAYIVGGENATNGRRSYKHAVSIQAWTDGEVYENGTVKLAAGWYHHCSGSLIDANKVITAAHCVDAEGGRYRVGINFLSLSDEHGPDAVIEEVWMLPKSANDPTLESLILFHPDYNRTTRAAPDQPADVAILVIKNAVVWKMHGGLVKKIRTHKAGYKLDNKICYIAGWGHPSEPNTPLQHARVVVMSNELCEKNLRVDSNVVLHDENICAISYPKLVSGCQGDGGAGLICKNKLAGVLSFGLLTCNGCVPDVFVRVGAHFNWIKKNLKKPNLKPKYLKRKYPDL